LFEELGPVVLRRGDFQAFKDLRALVRSLPSGDHTKTIYFSVPAEDIAFLEMRLDYDVITAQMKD